MNEGGMIESLTLGRRQQDTTLTLRLCCPNDEDHLTVQ
jgi:hypothetical protein